MATNPVYPDYTSDGKYKVVGTRPIRHDGVDKVTGQAIYGGDVRLPDLLYGKVLRSPHPHARILSIDTSKALQLAGVRAVATADDLVEAADALRTIGETTVNIREVAQNSLASEKVLYKGHAVAAVAATSPHIAEEALDLISVEYEPLPAIVDVREAMKDGAPLLDEKRTTRSLGEDTGKPSNIASHNQHRLGDIEAGFAKADVIVEREFHTATIHQGYIEPPKHHRSLQEGRHHHGVGSALRVPSTSAPRSPRCCRCPCPRSRSFRARSAVVSGASSRYIWNPPPPLCRSRPVIRSRWS